MRTAAARRARLDVVTAFPSRVVGTRGAPVEVPDVDVGVSVSDVPPKRRCDRGRARRRHPAGPGLDRRVDPRRRRRHARDRRAAHGARGAQRGTAALRRAHARRPARAGWAAGADRTASGRAGAGRHEDLGPGRPGTSARFRADVPGRMWWRQRRTRGGTTVGATRQRIVVGVDGSPGARLALSWALAEAARRGADVEGVAAYPVDFYWTDPYLLDSTRLDAVRADTEARARALVDEMRSQPDLVGAADVAVDVVVCGGAPAAHLVRHARDAALLVVGSRGRGGVRSAVAGSVALHCAAHAPCSVVVVHPAAVPASEPGRVVVGLDDSDHARAALAPAGGQAAALGPEVEAGGGGETAKPRGGGR